MRRLCAWLVLAAALLGATGAVPASAQGVPAPAALLPDSDHAIVLAKLLNDEAHLVGEADDDQKLMAMIPELFGSKEVLAKTEAKYPGISIEMARAMLPIVNRSMKQRLPVLWQRQAALYKSSLTSPEIDRLTAFYSSPTGQKMLAIMYRKVKPAAMLAEAKASEDFKISSGSALKDIRATVPDVMAELTAEDRRVLMTAFSPPGLQAKMRALAPQTQAISLAWINESLPGEEEELVTAAVAVIKRRATGESSK